MDNSQFPHVTVPREKVRCARGPRSNDLQDKARGCLIAGAAGDALGYAVEFMSYRQIVAKYGAEGITRYHLNSAGVAEISDDTQMSLYTANGLLINDIPAAYLEWLDTQTMSAKAAAGKSHKCRISNIPELYSRRAPGCTCMSALRCMANGEEVKNNSKGCGGIMRVAPIALYNVVRGIPPRQTALQACEAARLTHRHPLGWLPAGIFAFALHKQILDNTEDPLLIAGNFEEGLKVAADIFPTRQEDHDELLRGIRLAADLAISNPAEGDEPNIRKIGEGWTGEEALYIALYCCLRHLDNPEKAIIAAANHSGDSDSTAAITGNFMGAMHGYSAIPLHLKSNLELRSEIETMADTLTTEGNF